MVADQTTRAIELTADQYEVRWTPQPGSQNAFLCSPIYETLYAGERGPGKTDALLMDFARHCGPDTRTQEQIDAGAPQVRGYGADWRGIIFRRTYPELEDIIAKSQRWFRAFFPEARFNSQKSFWSWPTGEKLLFRNFQRPRDYWQYHGHAYPWIGWEELTAWPTGECYTSMFSCSRTTNPHVPIKIRSTTNPYGAGHNWVKARWRLDGCPRAKQVIGEVIDDATDDDGETEPPRVAIFGRLEENRILMRADPKYAQRIRASASNPAMADAWLRGSWDIVAGGMFDAQWSKDVHLLEPFQIPESWRIDRSFDWGSSKPFAVIWCAQSDGSDVRLPDGRTRSTVRGDLFVIREWYGWNGKPDQGLRLTAGDITRGIRERELRWGFGNRVRPGVADSAIYSEENGSSIAGDMLAAVRLPNGERVSGVQWIPADKRSGSRKAGWQRMAQMLQDAHVPDSGVRERPGLFVFAGYCAQWVRTVPTLVRDDKDPDDVDTNVEDHLGDATRYRVMYRPQATRQSGTTGHY